MPYAATPLDFKPFIYGLVDPRSPKHVRYVGMALQPRRPYDHTKKLKKKLKPSHFLHWLRVLDAAGVSYSVLVLEELPCGASRTFVGQIEKCYIKALRSVGHQLTNVSDGGWGGANIRTTKVSEGVAKANRERVWSLEARARASETQKQRYADPAERAKHSRPHSDASKAKQSAATRGVPKSAAHRQALSDVQKKLNRERPKPRGPNGKNWVKE